MLRPKEESATARPTARVSPALIWLALAGSALLGAVIVFELALTGPAFVLLVVAVLLTVVGFILERGVRDAFRVAFLWWSLDNAQLLAATAFPVAGTLAALAAVNFFYFVPEIAKPTVTTVFYVDTSRLPTLVSDAAVEVVVVHIANHLTKEAVRASASSYSQAQALSQDCAVAKEDVGLLVANACDASPGLPTIVYPEYLHDLFAAQHPADQVVPSYLPILTPEQLNLAVMDLRSAAVSVAAVTIVNNGHVDATNVQLVAPPGVQPLQPNVDRLQFDLPARKPQVVFFRQPDASLAGDTSIPVEGFYVGSDTGDSVIGQQFALHLLIGTGVFFLILVGRDMFRTRQHPGERPPKRS